MPMTWTPAIVPGPEPTAVQRAEAKHQVMADLQAFVDAGFAQWWVNDDGDTELHLNSGEVFLIGENDLVRLI